MHGPHAPRHPSPHGGLRRSFGEHLAQIWEAHYLGLQPASGKEFNVSESLFPYMQMDTCPSSPVNCEDQKIMADERALRLPAVGAQSRRAESDEITG